MSRTISLSQRLSVSLGFMALFAFIMWVLTQFNFPIQIRFANLAYSIIAASLAIILTVVVYRKWSGGDSFSLKPEGQTVYRFLMGIIIGCAVALAIMWCIGKYAGIKLHVNPTFSLITFASGCLSIFLLAWAEEMVFRGQAFSGMQKGSTPWIGLVVATLGFVLYRVANGWTFQDALFGPGSWGLLFGLAAMRTGGIAQSTGMQFAANVTQSLVGKSSFSWLSMNQDFATAQVMSEDIHRAGAWSQFALFIISLLLIVAHLRRSKRPQVA